MEKGVCLKKKKFYGVVTVTEKGQLALPVEIRKDLGIKKKDKLFVIKREDGKGVNLIKGEEVEDFLTKIAKD